MSDNNMLNFNMDDLKKKAEDIATKLGDEKAKEIHKYLDKLGNDNVLFKAFVKMLQTLHNDIEEQLEDGRDIDDIKDSNAYYVMDKALDMLKVVTDDKKGALAKWNATRKFYSSIQDRPGAMKQFGKIILGVVVAALVVCAIIGTAGLAAAAAGATATATAGVTTILGAMAGASAPAWATVVGHAATFFGLATFAKIAGPNKNARTIDKTLKRRAKALGKGAKKHKAVGDAKSDDKPKPAPVEDRKSSSDNDEVEVAKRDSVVISHDSGEASVNRHSIHAAPANKLEFPPIPEGVRPLGMGNSELPPQRTEVSVAKIEAAKRRPMPSPPKAEVGDAENAVAASIPLPPPMPSAKSVATSPERKVDSHMLESLKRRRLALSDDGETSNPAPRKRQSVMLDNVDAPKSSESSAPSRAGLFADINKGGFKLKKVSKPVENKPASASSNPMQDALQKAFAAKGF